MNMNLSNFLQWLNQEMDKGKITQADIARTKIVSDAAISLLFSEKTKELSFKMCKAISLATDIPLEIIYRKSGLLPSVPDDILWVKKMTYKLLKVPTSMRGIVENFIDSMGRSNHK